jgi:hypothetical protein
MPRTHAKPLAAIVIAMIAGCEPTRSGEERPMGDADVRALEKTFEESGDPRDGERYLLELERSRAPWATRLAVRARLHPVRAEGKAKGFKLAAALLPPRRESEDPDMVGEYVYKDRVHAWLLAKPIDEIERLVGAPLLVGDVVQSGTHGNRGVDTLLVGEELDARGFRRVLIDPARTEDEVVPPSYLCYPTRIPALDYWEAFYVEAVPLDAEWLRAKRNGPAVVVAGKTYAIGTDRRNAEQEAAARREHPYPHNERGTPYVFINSMEVMTLEQGIGYDNDWSRWKEEREPKREDDAGPQPEDPTPIPGTHR